MRGPDKLATSSSFLAAAVRLAPGATEVAHRRSQKPVRDSPGGVSGQRGVAGRCPLSCSSAASRRLRHSTRRQQTYGSDEPCRPPPVPRWRRRRGCWRSCEFRSAPASSRPRAVTDQPTGGGAVWAPRPLPTVAVAIAAASAAVFPVFLTGALTVQLRHALHLSTADIGFGVAAFFGSSALCSVSSGRAAERAGPWRVMELATMIALASMAGIGLLVHHLWNLLALLVLGGIGNGMMQPATNLLLSEVVHSGRQGLAFGIKQAGIPAATLLSGLAVPALVLTAGWQSAYLAGAAYVAGVLLVLHQQQRQDTVRNAPDSASQPAGRPRRAVQTPIDVRPLILLAAGMAAAVAASNAMGSFLVPSTVDHGVAPGSAGLLAALGSAVGFSVRTTAGWRADFGGRVGVRAAEHHLAVVVVMVAIGAGGYLALASGRSFLLVPGAVLGFGAGWGFNGLFNLAVVRAYAHAPGRATGITQVGTYIGGMTGPLFFGLLVDHVGYQAGWLLCAALAVVAVATFAASRYSLRRHLIDGSREAP